MKQITSRKVWLDLDVLKPCYPTATSAQCFDSVLECDTYRLLRKYYPQELIKLQFPLPLLEPTDNYPSGLTWIVDFVVIDPNSYLPQLTVEAKGDYIRYDTRWRSLFRIKTQLLEHFHYPFWQCLKVVSYREFKVCKNIQTYALKNFDSYLNSITA